MVRFRDALSGPGLSAIAEIKRRSPSAGDLRPGADPAALASELARAGAAAVSVLVDERFGGSLDDLRAARVATGLPLLGKGFFRSEDALAALAEAGADAVLLLLRDLDDIEASRLQARARELGLAARVESHDAVEIEGALCLGPAPRGLDGRDVALLRRGRKVERVTW